MAYRKKSQKVDPGVLHYRYMYLDKACYVKTYMDNNGSIIFKSYSNKKLMAAWNKKNMSLLKNKLNLYSPMFC